MAKKKGKPSPLSFGKTVTAAAGESGTTTRFKEPAENNGFAGEEVVVVDNRPTPPGTSPDEAPTNAGKNLKLEFEEAATSPYACQPIAIEFGPGLATYWVPQHLLRSTMWSTINSGDTICIPGVSAATGHTLVHFLYTGTYQTLKPGREFSSTLALIEFKEAILTLVLASTYRLHDLERLAKVHMELHGSRMTLVEVLDSVRKCVAKIAQPWFYEYLKARVEEQFDLDYTFFASSVFIESVGKGTLHKFITGHLLAIFSEKLTHTLKMQGSGYVNEGELDTVLGEVEDAAVRTHDCSPYHGGHQTGMYAGSDNMSFEFPNVPCEDVDDVISLKNSVYDVLPLSSSEFEPVPPPEPDPPAETEPETVPESLPVKEEEDSELKKMQAEEREEGATVAMGIVSTNVATDISWAEPAAANDGWDSFMAKTTAGKKKKVKKGKAEPTPPPPPTPPVDPPKTFDHIKFDEVNLDDGVPEIDMNLGDPGAAKTGSGSLGSLGEGPSAWGSSGWDLAGSSKDAASSAEKPCDSSDKKKERDSNGSDIGFNVVKGPTDAAPAADGKLIEDDGWGFSDTVIKHNNREKRSASFGGPIPEPEPVLAPRPENTNEEDPSSFTFDGAAKEKKKKKKSKKSKRGDAVEEEIPPPPPEPEAPPEPEPNPEPEPVKEEDPWGFAATAPSKKGKKKGKKERKLDEPPPPPEMPEPVLEPGPTPPEPEPEPFEEEPAVDPSAGLIKCQKNNLQDKMEKEAKQLEKEDAKRNDEEEGAAELVRQEQEAESERNLSIEEGLKETEYEEERLAQEVIDAEEATKSAATAEQMQREAEEAEAEAARLAAENEAPLARVFLKKKKNKKIKAVVMEEPPTPPSPPPATKDFDADLSDLVKNTSEDQSSAELGENLKTVPIPGTSSTLCPRRSYHLLEGDSWKSCERCYAMLREIAVQLARDNKIVLI